MKKENQWVITDEDCNQRGRKISEGIYEFEQDVKWPNKVITKEHSEIDLSEYSDKEIEEHLSPYGYSIEQLYEENNKEDATWLIAECIFEQELL